ncbi:MAG: beta-galactosidase, partial [Treponema sp.]|nr:beta-galactosidase [Treponema sp.]
VQSIKECGLYMILRIGPWSHAEVRNGGFPDWLQHNYKVRTNDAAYLAEVRRFYEKIFEQAKGLQLKDGGPIIGVQIENEFGHCGGLTGEEGERHMKTLQTMAKEIGFDVPLWTATGWGGAVTAGMLPVMGGYVDAPWDQRPTEIEPSGNYVITYERNDHNIGSDYGFGHGITFDPAKFPYVTAELGGGLEPTFLRRTVPTSADIGACSLVKMASGANLLGYYMYHGGTNPDGKLSTLQESKATGSLNDLCEKSYDFFAPVREYGQISPTYKELKLYALFAADFGEDFCKMKSVIPAKNPLDPADTKNLRHSFRVAQDGGAGANGAAGYLFVNNYVRHQKQAEHKGVTLEVPAEASQGQKDAPIKFGPLDIKDGDYFFLPFNMKVGDALLETATATPLCKINGDYVFYAPTQSDASPKSAAPLGLASDFGNNKNCSQDQNASQSQNAAASARFNFKDGKWPTTARVILLSRQQALNAYKIRRGKKEWLVIFDGEIADDGAAVSLRGEKKAFAEFYSYPELPAAGSPIAAGWTKSACGPLTKYAAQSDASPKSAAPAATVTPSAKQEPGKKFYALTIGGVIGQECLPALDDALIDIYYKGSYARLYKDGRLVADNLFCGNDVPWQLAARRFEPGQYELEIQELKEDEKIYLQDRPDFTDGAACDFVRSQTTPLYRLECKLD